MTEEEFKDIVEKVGKCASKKYGMEIACKARRVQPTGEWFVPTPDGKLWEVNIRCEYEDSSLSWRGNGLVGKEKFLLKCLSKDIKSKVQTINRLYR